MNYEGVGLQIIVKTPRLIKLQAQAIKQGPKRL